MKRLSLHPTDLTRRGEYKHVRTLRFLNIAVIGVLVIIVCQTLFFVYQNIFQSISRVETIILLRGELGTAAIDFQRLERIETAWEKKYSAPPPVLSRDPFRDPAPTTSTPARE